MGIIYLQVAHGISNITYFSANLNFISCWGSFLIMLNEMNECGLPICSAVFEWYFSESLIYMEVIEEPPCPPAR